MKAPKGASFNGRTAVSKTANLGSIPSAPAMKRFFNWYTLAGLTVLIGIAYWAAGYLAFTKDNVPYGDSQENTGSVEYIVEEVISGLEVPWTIAWTSKDRMLVAERPGRLWVVENGVLKPDPLFVFQDVSNESEEGLMGLAVDPDYGNTRFLYVCYAFQKGDKMIDRVVRLKDEGDRATIDRVILEDIPAARFHAGCRLAFGPDKKLYITTGDATDRNLAQELGSLAGKILRVNADGSIPEDNPFATRPGARAEIWSYGHRNPQGIAWHPETGEMYETEHGPSVFDGPAGGDEVNHITRGANYGWPLVSHERRRDGTATPLLVFTPAEAPASAAFYKGDTVPQFKSNFFFGALQGEGLFRIVIDAQDPDKIASYEKLSEVRFGRIREVAQGPDGFLYFSTSNRDGRGSPDTKDDRIFRIRPKE